MRISKLVYTERLPVTGKYLDKPEKMILMNEKNEIQPGLNSHTLLTLINTGSDASISIEIVRIAGSISQRVNLKYELLFQCLR